MSFGSHEMIVRVAFSGDFDSGAVHGWIVGEAARIGLNGWTKDRLADGCIEALFAGDASDVVNMIRGLTDGREAQGISDISEQPVSGHEPVWLGFHHLPPV